VSVNTDPITVSILSMTFSSLLATLIFIFCRGGVGGLNTVVPSFRSLFAVIVLVLVCVCIVYDTGKLYALAGAGTPTAAAPFAWRTRASSGLRRPGASTRFMLCAWIRFWRAG